MKYDLGGKSDFRKECSSYEVARLVKLPELFFLEVVSLEEGSKDEVEEDVLESLLSDSE